MLCLPQAGGRISWAESEPTFGLTYYPYPGISCYSYGKGFTLHRFLYSKLYQMGLFSSWHHGSRFATHVCTSGFFYMYLYKGTYQRHRRRNIRVTPQTIITPPPIVDPPVSITKSTGPFKIPAMSNPPPHSESSYADAGSPLPNASPRSDDDSSSDSPLVLYRPPTLVGLLRTAAINLVLPFINGLMLGFGELFAHEIAFKMGWGGTRVCAVRPMCFYEDRASGWRLGLRAGMGVEDWEMEGKVAGDARGGRR